MDLSGHLSCSRDLDLLHELCDCPAMKSSVLLLASDIFWKDDTAMTGVIREAHARH